jgi:hypothetical protein
MSRPDPDTIRTDIYSVKANMRDGVGESHVFMTKNVELARQRQRDIVCDHSLGFNRTARIVHPRQWVVEAYVAVGNEVV